MRTRDLIVGLLALILVCGLVCGHRAADQAGREPHLAAPETTIPEVPLEIRQAARDEWEDEKPGLDREVEDYIARGGNDWPAEHNRLYNQKQAEIAAKYGLTPQQMIRIVVEPRR